MKTNLIITIKPTKQNQALLKKRGLFSDDSKHFFKMFEMILSNQIYEFISVGSYSDNLIVNEFANAGLKF